MPGHFGSGVESVLAHACMHRDFNVFIFFPGQRQASRGLHLKQSQLQPFCHTEIRERGGFHYTDSSLWHGSIGGLEGRQAGSQTVGLVGRRW